MEPKELDDKSLKDVPPPAESSEINTRAVLIFCVVLIAIAVLVHVSMWYLFNVFDTQKKSADPALSPLAPRQQQLPPEPRLQAMPNTSDLQKPQIFNPKGLLSTQDEENKVLDSYGWVDEKNGVVRIPIEEAMKLVVEREKQTQKAPAIQRNVVPNVQQ